MRAPVCFRRALLRCFGTDVTAVMDRVHASVWAVFYRCHTLFALLKLHAEVLLAFRAAPYGELALMWQLPLLKQLQPPGPVTVFPPAICRV